MIWFAYIATALALGVLIMMHREILTGYYRWRDYLVAAPLLYAAAVVLFILDGLISAFMPVWWLLAPIKLVLGFALMVVVWGGTLALGAMVLRALATIFTARP